MCASLALSVVGCGAGSSAAPASTPSPLALNGNWLLAGEIPVLLPAGPGSTGFGLAMTFSVVGDQIVGGGWDQISCGQFAAGGGAVVSGTVTRNGRFTAQTSNSQLLEGSSLQISGIVPSNNGSAWTGNYTFSSTDSNCPFSSSGPIAAVRIADLTGTYSGPASLSPPIGTAGNSQPVSVTMTLQQGQAVAGPATGAQSVNEAVLSGSIQVQGTSCFSSGQIVQPQPYVNGNILGTNVLATFTMDDGSHLRLSGNIEDTLSSKFAAVSLLSSGGKCDGQFTQPFELSRQ
jgi:hypothetical protein